MRQFYKNWIGISLKTQQLHSNFEYLDGQYSIFSIHPQKSHRWLMAVYYDANKPLLKRITCKFQRPLWKVDIINQIRKKTSKSS